MNVMRRNHWLVLLLSLSAWATANSAYAAENIEALNLPTEPTKWINSTPLNSEMLKGKAALFYLFEEG